MSTFQNLSWHIAEAIADHCLSIHHPREPADAARARASQLIWLKLYNVSHLWRYFALKDFFKQATIYIDIEEVVPLRLMFDYLASSIQIDKSLYYSFVKYVVIRFKLTILQTDYGPFLAPAKPWPGNVVFPSARSLNISYLDDYHLQKAIYTHFAGRVTSITQSIRSLIPNLQYIAICSGDIFRSDTRQYDVRLPNTSERLWTVFDKAMSMSSELTNVQDIRSPLLAQDNIGLTKLIYVGMLEENHFSTILERAAPTLESLSVSCYNGPTSKYLILGPSGKPIMYPKLQRIECHDHSLCSPSDLRQLDESVAPFSALRHIEGDAAYLFKNGIMFRENSGSLESLSISLSAPLVEVLEKRQVFSGGKYSRLNQVDICCGTSHEWNLNSGLYLTFVGDILSSQVRSLKLQHTLAYEGLLSYVVSISYSDSIRTLHISQSMFTIPELLELVHNLPNLTMLCLTGLGDEDEDYQKDATIIDKSFIDEACTNYNPLSKYFKYLELSQNWYNKPFLTAEATLVLAILCPNFVMSLTWAEDLPDTISEFNLKADIKRIMDSEVYDGHRNEIERVFERIQ